MSFISEAQYLPEELTIEWGELGCNIQSSLLKILHFQNLHIEKIEKITFLTSFDVRLAHAGTSAIFLLNFP